MKTPDGKECKYYYEDYYRGREKQECRLLNSIIPPLNWQPRLCATCPIPDILRDNACTYMVLRPTLIRKFPFIKQSISVSAYCMKTEQVVKEPRIGCGECHPLPFNLPEKR